MPQPLDYLKEFAAQTAGPWVHIGLAPGAAGFDIYRQELGRNIAGAGRSGRMDRGRRCGAGRHRRFSQKDWAAQLADIGIGQAPVVARAFATRVRGD